MIEMITARFEGTAEVVVTLLRVFKFKIKVPVKVNNIIVHIENNEDKR